MSKLSFRARALDASKPMPIYLAEELPDLPEYSAINRAVPQMPSGMEKEEESEHHLQRAICTGLIIPTPEVCELNDLEFYERCYPPDYKMPKQHIHMQPLWQEQETPEYDIDSEDELWLKQQRHPELTELKFEQMMDKLEKSSGQTVVTLNEAKLLLERNDDLVIAVYDYWLNKRLKTQHPLVSTVKTDSRPGQSTNNPYLAFRRRTEKMQTRKNRKNDESSYEKMLKLRRELARALSLLELVMRRERAKRELVRLTALLNERRYVSGDFTQQLPDLPPSRPSLVGVAPPPLRRELYVPPPPISHDSRQREKRPYKRRKHRHHAVSSPHTLRDSGIYSSSEEESPVRAEPSTPPDEGPFAFRRKAGCYYEMPTSTLYGDPVDPENTSKDALYQHEVDEKARFSLTSLSEGYRRCVGLARRRVGRGGRLHIDRYRTPLDDLWPTLPFHFVCSTEYKEQVLREQHLEAALHREPYVVSRDYDSTSKYPWRRQFRRHVRRHPHLWTEQEQFTLEDKFRIDGKGEDLLPADVKQETIDYTSDNSVSDKRTYNSDVKYSDSTNCNSDSAKFTCDNARFTSDSAKFTSDSAKFTSDSAKYCSERRDDSSDSSYNSDASLDPVEQEFEKFIDEVNKKWLHFRPKTPPPAPPVVAPPLSRITPHTPLAVELTALKELPSAHLDTFLTTEFTLADLYGDVIKQDADQSGSLDLEPDLTDLPLTDAQVESILSDSDLKTLTDDDKKLPLSEDILDELVNSVDKSFLLQGQSSFGLTNSGRARRQRSGLGSSLVTVLQDELHLYHHTHTENTPEPPPIPQPVKIEPKKEETPPAPVQNKPKPANTKTPQLPKSPQLTKSPQVPKSPQVTKTPQLTKTPQVKTPQVAKSPQVAKTSQVVKSPQVAKAPQVARSPQVVKTPQVAKSQQVVSSPAPVPTSKIIVEEVNEVPHIKVEQKKVRPLEEPQNSVEEVSLPHGVQLKTVQTLHSPLKKHIITSGTHRRSDLALVSHEPQILTVAVSDSVKVRLQNHLVASSSSGNMVGLVHNGPAHHQTQRDMSGGSVCVSSRGGRPLVVAPHALHHLPPNKLKVLHAHSLTHNQRTQLLAQRTGITQLPAVVSLATLGDAKATPAALQLKAAPGQVTQLFEIKGGQLGKGPHLVNVVRQPQPGKTTVTRLDLNDAKKRQVVATFDGALKGNIATTARPHRVTVSQIDGRQIVRAGLPQVRAPIRQQIHLKNRTLQVTGPQLARPMEPSSSITITAPTKTATIPSSMVANLLQKNVHLPKTGQKIAISGPGQNLAANVQAIAFTTAQFKARQAKLIAQPRSAPVTEIVESSVASTSSAQVQQPVDPTKEDPSTNGSVRRSGDTLPMEVT